MTSPNPGYLFKKFISTRRGRGGDQAPPPLADDWRVSSILDALAAIRRRELRMLADGTCRTADERAVHRLGRGLGNRELGHAEAAGEDDTREDESLHDELSFRSLAAGTTRSR